MESEKKDNMVERAMEDDASAVSLFNCDERTYSAVDVGNEKNIIPTLNARPEIPKILKNMYPVTGSTSNLKTAATRDNLKWLLIVLRLNAPPMEINASGRATDEASLNVFSIKFGNPVFRFAYTRPQIQPMIRGLATKALAI